MFITDLEFMEASIEQSNVEGGFYKSKDYDWCKPKKKDYECYKPKKKDNDWDKPKKKDYDWYKSKC